MIMKVKIILILMTLLSFKLFADNAYLGIYISDLKPELLKAHGLTGGILVDSVLSDSPAKKHGLVKNSIIYQLNNWQIRNEKDFQRALTSCQAYQMIKIYAVIKNQKRVLNVKLGKRDDLYKELYLYNYVQNPWLFIGIDIEPLNRQLARFFSVSSGVLVTNIRDHSIASKNGLFVGDVITHINQNAVNSENDLSRQLALGLKKQPIVISVIRKKVHLEIKLDLTVKKRKTGSSDDIYIIGPDMYDSELYRYSKEQVNQILNKSNVEIENEIERLENEIDVLKQKIKSKP